MLKDFQAFIVKEKLFIHDNKILLGVSGGVDSMVMSSLFLQSGYKFGIAHCNFSLRGTESDADEKFVIDFAKKNNIPVFSKKFETTQYASSNKNSIQMAARELRIQWFRELLKNKNYDYYATAHHKDDQVETFFINLTRGTGISGLHGIRPKYGKLVHPMLPFSRNEITDYLKKNNIAFREDRSNKKTNYERNKIRHNIIPEFEKLKADFTEVMSENILRIQSAEKIYQNHIQEVFKSLSSMENDHLKIDINELLQLPENLTYIYEFIKRYGFNYSDAGQIKKALSGQPGKFFLSNSHKLVIDRKFILVKDLSMDIDMPDEFIIKYKNQIVNNPIKIVAASYELTQDFNIDADENVLQMDSSKIAFPLKFRHWRKGDLFYPIGAKGKKLVSDYFSDNKFSLLQKEKTWLMTSEGNIVWIVGHRMDDRYKISKHSKMVQSIEYFPKSSNN